MKTPEKKEPKQSIWSGILYGFTPTATLIIYGTAMVIIITIAITNYLENPDNRPDLFYNGLLSFALIQLILLARDASRENKPTP
jgi:hypothetical protein